VTAPGLPRPSTAGTHTSRQFESYCLIVFKRLSVLAVSGMVDHNAGTKFEALRLDLQDGALKPRRRAIGQKSIFRSPPVYGAAKLALRKGQPIGQAIDLHWIDVNVGGNQLFCIWASEHQQHRPIFSLRY
jgi:hypothetical protein